MQYRQLATRLALGAAIVGVSLPSVAHAATSYCQGRVATIVSSAGTISGTVGVDTILATGNKAHTINAKGGDDFICGDTKNDIINGEAGNDTIFPGSAGTDIVRGGSSSGDAGTDTITLVDLTVSQTQNLDLGSTVSQTVHPGLAVTLSGIENATGSNFSDEIAPGSGTNVINGGAGNDRLYALGSGDTINGGTETVDSGGDTLDLTRVTNGAVTVQLPNSVTLAAGTLTVSGFESVAGTAFNDTLKGDANRNAIEGGPGTGSGNDVIQTGGGSDWGYGYDGDDSIDLGTDGGAGEEADGGSGNDTITAASTTGRVYIVGRAGNDSITGGSGNDQLYGQGVNYNGVGTDGIDIIYGGAGNDLIAGDTIGSGDGGYGADTLFGESGDDNIYGGAGDDAIYGGSSGSNGDAIFGEVGADRLFGDDGAGNVDTNDSCDGGTDSDIDTAAECETVVSVP